MFQGDIIMNREIRNSLNSRGVLVPGDDPSRMLPVGWRPKRAIMKVSSGRDLRWLVGSSGKREVPYVITSSNCKFKSILKELRHGLCILKNLAPIFLSSSFAIRVNLFHP